MKRCGKCGQNKPLEAFWRNRVKPQGRRSCCIECEKVRTRTPQYRAKHAADHRRRYGTPRGKVQYRRYATSEKGRAARKRTRLKNRVARRANQVVAEATRAKQIPSARTLICADCGRGASQYHHESYARERWLDVVSLCTLCHGARHSKAEAERRAKRGGIKGIRGNRETSNQMARP